MVAFHIALYGSLVVSAPFWLYFLGQFILPALRVHERRFLFTWLGWGVLLFLIGVLLTYFLLTAFFLVYVPFSKISHYLYYPFTRYWLGRSLGYRGVFPIESVHE